MNQLRNQTMFLRLASAATACGAIGMGFGPMAAVLASLYLFITVTVSGLWMPEVSAKNDRLEEQVKVK